ncbi:MAG TPA: DNA internalization-related competence protein ComEC/Rec2 [Polyangiales bacterium]|nr:DNA internalization-related competence protein ComEC/Rec2 [Polyangiales bacterium]
MRGRRTAPCKVRLVMAVTCFAASMVCALGLRALGWVPGADWLWWLLGASGWVTASLLRRGWLGAWLAALCWGVALAPARVEDDEVPSGGLARLGFQVERGGCGGRGCFAEAVALRCTELEPGACVRAGTRLGVGSVAELPAGAQLTALVRVRPRVRFDNPSESASWLDTRGGCSATVQRGAQPRVDHLSALASAIAVLRVRMRALLERTLKPPHSGIARALLLGEGSAVDPELNEAIRDAGVSHVLAVSGMHVTLLVGAWVLAVRRTWLFTPWAATWEARRVGAALGAVLAPLLARLCGGSPSANRAAWTSMVMYLVTSLGLRPAAMPVAALVTAAFAVLDPREALHPGFLLSVLATAALLSDRPRPKLAHPVLAFVSTAFRTSWRAWLATTPFLLLCFGQLALIPLLANVALLPLGEALVPMAAVHLASAPLDLLATDRLFTLLSGAFVEGARRCATLDPGLTLPPPTPVQTLCIAALAISALVPCGWRVRGLVGALGVVIGVGSELALQLPADTLRVTFLDVGQGDATLLESDGKAMLIDAGGAIGPGPDPGALSVVPALRARRIDKLARVVLSHPHPDHYGGLPAVLATFPTDELWDNGQGPAEDVQPVLEILDAARARGTRTPLVQCGTSMLGRARVEVLAPCPGFDFTREPNDNSFVLRVSHGAHTFLLTGDIEREAEADLIARIGHADVLKLGHHGSRTSSAPEFLRAVAPILAIASAGRGNGFGHPHPEVVQRLGTRLLRTDREGGIELTSDGRTLRVRSARQPRWRDVMAPAS